MHQLCWVDELIKWECFRWFLKHLATCLVNTVKLLQVCHRQWNFRHCDVFIRKTVIWLGSVDPRWDRPTQDDIGKQSARYSLQQNCGHLYTSTACCLEVILCWTGHNTGFVCTGLLVPLMNWAPCSILRYCYRRCYFAGKCFRIRLTTITR